MSAVASAKPEALAKAAPAPLSPEAKTLLAGIALSGFAAMACEVAWSRVLALVLGSSVYSFGMMVLVFLIGLSAGSAIFTRLARGTRRPASIFAASQVGATVALVAATLLVPRLPALFLRGFPVAQASFGMLQAWNFVLAALLLGPSALFFGIAFPAAIAATHASPATLGSGVGRVTAANTLGTVAGAFAAGFLLIPRWAQDDAGRRRRRDSRGGDRRPAARCPEREAARPDGRRCGLLRPRSPAAAVAPQCHDDGRLFLCPKLGKCRDLSRRGPLARRALLQGRRQHDAVGEPPERRALLQLEREDGRLDGPRRHGQPDLPRPAPDAPASRIPRTSSSWASARASRPRPSRGIPSASIEIVDIEPSGREAARLFEPENHNLLADPRVKLVTADGRNRLLAQPRKYDVIISDPSDVWVAGVGSLFTQEFYALARKRLNPGGLMVQWFHMHSLPPDQLKLIVATFQFVFPYTSLWRPNRGDVILVGSADRVVWNWDRLKERFANVPGVSQDLLSIGIWGPLAVFAPYVCDGQELATFLRGVTRTHTDDRPIIEYLSPRAAYEDTTTANDRLITEAQGHFLPFMDGFDDKRDIDAHSGYLLGFGHAFLGRTATAIKIMEEAVRAAPQNARYLVGLGNQYKLGGSESKATGAYRRALEASPAEAEAAQNLAAILRGQGDDAEAEKVLRACLAAAPDAVGVADDLARLFLDIGRGADALPVLERSFQVDPSNGATLLLYGRALAGAGRGPEAIPHLRKARTALADDAASQRALGELLLIVGDLDESTLAWTRAVSIDPANVEGYIGLARVAQRRGDAAAERDAIRRAKQIDPSNAQLAGR